MNKDYYYYYYIIIINCRVENSIDGIACVPLWMEANNYQPVCNHIKIRLKFLQLSNNLLQNMFTTNMMETSMNFFEDKHP